MGLSHDDVREILRIIDESNVAELRLQTDGFSLYVRRGDAAGGAHEVPLPEPSEAPQDTLLTIESPMLGTFYRAEAPGAKAFVEVGSQVEPDTTVCIIEVMKMMNSVPAGVAGTIEEICVENSQLVEYKQPLFRVRPA